MKPLHEQFPDFDFIEQRNDLVGSYGFCIRQKATGKTLAVTYTNFPNPPDRHASFLSLLNKFEEMTKK